MNVNLQKHKRRDLSFQITQCTSVYMFPIKHVTDISFKVLNTIQYFTNLFLCKEWGNVN